MPHDAITLREDVVEKTLPGGHDMVVRTQHEAAAGPDNEIIVDKHTRQDLANAKWMMDVLLKAYPQRPWRCKHDGAQGMAYVSIPILMGINNYWAINLKSDPLTEAMLVRCGGALLERYSMSRQRFNTAEFLDAREKHSALVLPSRKVPE